MTRELKVGDRIKDNDPRMRNRGALTVIRLWFPTNPARAADDGKAICEDNVCRQYAILLRRIHTDGKPRRGGFSLVDAA